MAQSPVATLARLARPTLGVFRGHDAIEAGVTRRQLDTLRAAAVIERELPDTFRLTSVARSARQRLWAALLWAGDESAACGRSAGAEYGLEGVEAPRPEIAVPRSFHGRADTVQLLRASDMRSLMIRTHRGMRVVGIEATILQLAHQLNEERLEIACEEVKTRRLLVHHGIAGFDREYPLAGTRREYFFDFAFVPQRTILETNGRRWHDDPNDYESDNEKWSVPGRHGFKLVLATWDKVTKHPTAFVEELRATLAA